MHAAVHAPRHDLDHHECGRRPGVAGLCPHGAGGPGSGDEMGVVGEDTTAFSVTASGGGYGNSMGVSDPKSRWLWW